jgi:hypothetical protein
MLLCRREDNFLKLSALMGECWGADWENVATHALITSNPVFVSSRFRSGGLKRLEMLSNKMFEPPDRELLTGEK